MKKCVFNLDPDLYWKKHLDPDPYKMYTDSKHWLKLNLVAALTSKSTSSQKICTWLLVTRPTPSQTTCWNRILRLNPELIPPLRNTMVSSLVQELWWARMCTRCTSAASPSSGTWGNIIVCFFQILTKLRKRALIISYCEKTKTVLWYLKFFFLLFFIFQF